ncbi:MAG: hypothetical protein AAFZ07_04695 [Actinomycetota bacterium]
MVDVEDVGRCRASFAKQLSTVLEDGYSPNSAVTAAGHRASLEAVSDDSGTAAVLAESILDLRRAVDGITRQGTVGRQPYRLRTVSTPYPAAGGDDVPEALVGLSLKIRKLAEAYLLTGEDPLVIEAQIADSLNYLSPVDRSAELLSAGRFVDEYVATHYVDDPEVRARAQRFEEVIRRLHG